MGAFWSNISQTSTGHGKDAKRSKLNQARMQLLQQLVAAILNNAAFGSEPSGSISIADARDAFLNGSLQEVKDAMTAMATFNESGDTGVFTPGVSANGIEGKIFRVDRDGVVTTLTSGFVLDAFNIAFDNEGNLCTNQSFLYEFHWKMAVFRNRFCGNTPI